MTEIAQVSPQTELAQIRADRAAGLINDHEWRTKAEPRVLELSGMGAVLEAHKSLPPHLQAAQREEWATGATNAIESQIASSVGNQNPASSPYAYNLAQSRDAGEEELAEQTQFRRAAFQGKMPTWLAERLWDAMIASAGERLHGEDNGQDVDADHRARSEKREGAFHQGSEQFLSELRTTLRGKAPEAYAYFERGRSLLTHPDVRRWLLHWAHYLRNRV